MSGVDEKKKSRAELLQAREARERAEGEREDAREMLVLELDDQFSQGGQRRGRDFEIVEDWDVPIVVKRAAGVVYTKWKAEPSSVQSDNEFLEASIVHPTVAEFHAMAKDFPILRIRTMSAAIALYGAKIRDDAGKF